MSKTKTAPKAKKSKGYASLMKYIEGVPLAKRRELAIGRDGAKVKPRGYHLSEDKVAKLAERFNEGGKDLVILADSYNRGNYHYIILALLSLGVDEQHSKAKVFAKVKSLMSRESTKDEDGATDWDRFEGKDPRSAESGLDVDGRLDQNVSVLQRVNTDTSASPYGYKLLQVMQEIAGKTGGVIDILVGDRSVEYLRLNTKSVTPINQTKKRGMGSPSAIAAEKAAAKAASAGSKKAKTRKAKVVKETPETTPVEAETATA
jgi:hypothetical protein